MHDARKAWHIGDILTITTGFLVSPRRFGYLALQEYMANRTLNSGERLLYSPEFRSALLGQYPELREFCLDYPLPDELCGEWLRRRVTEFGEYLPVNRLPPNHHVRARRFSEAVSGSECTPAPWQRAAEDESP